MMWIELEPGIHEAYYLNARIVRIYEFTDQLGNNYFNYEVTTGTNTFSTSSFYYIKTKLKVKQLKLF